MLVDPDRAAAATALRKVSSLRRVATFQRARACTTLATYHPYASCRPSSSPIVASHPKAFSRDTSSSFLGVPSGVLASNTGHPANPVTRAIEADTEKVVGVHRRRWVKSLRFEWAVFTFSENRDAQTQ